MAEIRTLQLHKRGHTYIYRYRPGEEPAVIELLIERAQEKGGAIDWFDAAILSSQLGLSQAQMQFFKKKALRG